MKHLILIIGFMAVLFVSCGNDLPILGDFGNEKFELQTQNYTSTFFPDIIKGKIGVVGYIFTNCPDICPLTTNNMRLVQEELKKKNIGGVEFISLSFDPEVDTPARLRKYAELRKLDLSNWTFLTGKKEVTDSLIKQAGVMAFVADSTVTEDETIYYFVHTDRISLVDAEGKIRKNYSGSRANIEEIVNDIKILKD